MATALNCTVKCYKGVPLVKGGTEVLYLSQGAAEGVLGAFLSKTFNQYYYTRENRGAIQVDSPIGDLEGCNYVSFQNNSHGGKLYFGFIDRLVYINDNNTEIQFTIDPFPTYLGDTKELDSVYVVRNSPTMAQDVRDENLQDDYVPNSAKVDFHVIEEKYFTAAHPVVYYAGKGTDPELTALGTNTGIKVGQLTDAKIKSIQEDGGVIIGTYLQPGTFGVKMVNDMGTMGGDPLADISGYSHQKVYSGVYHKVVLMTPQGAKTYELERFKNPRAVSFQVVGLAIPAPAIFVYPLNYDGVLDNTAEGVMSRCPSLPISAGGVITKRDMVSDLSAIVTGAVGGAGTGFITGGVPGAILGAGLGLIGTGTNAIKNAVMSEFKPPQIYGSGEAIVNPVYNIPIQLLTVSPSQKDLKRIDDYFEYFGYHIDAQKDTGTVNKLDKAYLQTGSEMLAGSEADLELNNRLMSGIKIRKTLG